MNIDYDCVECGRVFRIRVAKSGCLPRVCPACRQPVDYETAAEVAAGIEQRDRQRAALQLRGYKEIQ